MELGEKLWHVCPSHSSPPTCSTLHPPNAHTNNAPTPPLPSPPRHTHPQQPAGHNLLHTAVDARVEFLARAVEEEGAEVIVERAGLVQVQLCNFAMRIGVE